MWLDAWNYSSTKGIVNNKTFFVNYQKFTEKVLSVQGINLVQRTLWWVVKKGTYGNSTKKVELTLKNEDHTRKLRKFERLKKYSCVFFMQIEIFTSSSKSKFLSYVLIFIHFLVAPQKNVTFLLINIIHSLSDFFFWIILLLGILCHLEKRELIVFSFPTRKERSEHSTLAFEMLLHENKSLG